MVKYKVNHAKKSRNKGATKQTHQSIGVRFLATPNKIWTYRVKLSAGVYVGQLLVVENNNGTSVVCVVAVRKEDQLHGIEEGRHEAFEIKEITMKVAPL
jgi:hypothetical protein